MSFARQHLKLILLIFFASVCAVFLFIGGFEENILALIPKNIQKQTELFQHSPLSQKLIVFTHSSSAAQAEETARAVQDGLLEEGLIRPLFKPSEDFISVVLSALPARFTRADAAKAERKISSEGAARQFALYREQLFSFESMFVKRRIVQDPFAFTDLIFNKWAEIGNQPKTSYQNGFLTSSDGTVYAGLYDVNADVSDLTAAKNMEKFFSDFQKKLPDGIRVFFMGGLRYSLENMSVIKRDLKVISVVGITLLAMAFIYFFRSRRALLIYFLPLIIIAPAALITKLLFGGISGITLGFGSVVAGLSADYAVYVYFALQSGYANVNKTMLQIRKHLWCNFLTSGLCFAALLFSSVAVFKQVAVFSLAALLLALLTALYVFSPYFLPDSVRPNRAKVLNCPVLSLRWALTLSFCLLIFGLWGIKNISFGEGLDSLSSVSSDFEKDKQISDKLFSAESRALLFSLGRTSDEALSNNEALSKLTPKPLAVSELFISERTRAENQTRWNNFWTPARLQTAAFVLHKESEEYGFNYSAFDPFLNWLKRSFLTQEKVDFSVWYNPVLKLSDGAWAVVNIVPDDAAYESAAEGDNYVFISAPKLKAELTQNVKSEAFTVALLALLFNFVTVWILFRRIKDVLLCFVPIVLGGCFLFGMLALSRVRVNLFGLIFMPLLIGLGIDYAIFQLMKRRSADINMQGLYPAGALAAAGVSTLIGFGVLVLADHSVLFIMGLCALIGIGGTVLAALFILPAFFEKIE